MFDQLIRRLEKLGREKLSVSLPDDGDGYMDRQCSSSSCEAMFKVDASAWSAKVLHALEAFCVFCRHSAEGRDGFHTKAQVDYVYRLARDKLDGIVSDAMAKDATRHNAKERRRPKNRFIDISMTMSVRRIPKKVLVPLASTEALRQQFACSECGFRWASLGASFFCHACGHNCVSTTFGETLATVRSTISSLETIRATLAGAQDTDTAANTVRQLREDQFSRVVGAFECLSKALFETLPNAAHHHQRGNVFQRVDDASAIWAAATGSGYGHFLSAAELDDFRRLVQQRHVLGHCQGIVDQKYIDYSGDATYGVGQRLVVQDVHVLTLVGLVQRLAAGLRGLVP
ncbi:MAG: hypothetical protein KDE27_16315 [Planctomycetes bacterium]|nr:hypothetical protein [Planctomycetota bacterium]